MRGTSAAILAVALSVCISAHAARAQLAVSVNDGKVRLVDGKLEVQKSPQSDSVAIIDLRATPPKIIAQIDVPGSVIGPPLSVAVSPREEFALVTSARRIDPTDPTRQIPDDRVTVIDLTPLKPGLLKRLGSAVGVSKGPAPMPKVIATLQAGMGASGVSINRAGTLALVANRDEGTVSIFSVRGGTVAPAGKVTVGGEKSSPSHVVFSLDGRHAFVTRDGDHRIAVLSVDGSKVEMTKREMAAGLRPYAIDVAAKSAVAVVSNVGAGLGDADTISVIDLKADPMRVVNTVTVGPSPQGMKISPDGKFVAVVLGNGTDKPQNSPLYNANGLLQVWARSGTQLTKAAEIPIGKWCEGIAWSRNSRAVLVQCMAEQEISIIRFTGLTGRSLQKTSSIKMKGGPAAIRSAEP
jgi:DNA-binding beta-propeller fold protein YncE